MRPYLHSDCAPTAHTWADALLYQLMPPSSTPGVAPSSAPPPPAPPAPATGWHAFRWIQANSVGMDAEHLMRRYGIPVRNRYVQNNRSITGAEVGFDVPLRQAHWAEYLLCRAGWTLVTPLLDPRHATLLTHVQRYGPSRPAGGGRIRRQGLIAKLYGILDELAGPGAAMRERTQPRQTHWRRSHPSRRRPSPHSSLWTRLTHFLTAQ